MDNPRVRFTNNGVSNITCSAGGENALTISSLSNQGSDGNKALSIQNAGVETFSVSYRGYMTGVSDLILDGKIKANEADFGPGAVDTNSTVTAVHIAGRNNAFTSNGRTTSTGQSSSFVSYTSPADGTAAGQLIGFLSNSRTYEGTASCAIAKGFSCEAAIAQASKNYGFYSNIPHSDTNENYNVYAAGDAENYFADIVTSEAGFNDAAGSTSTFSGDVAFSGGVSFSGEPEATRGIKITGGTSDIGKGLYTQGKGIATTFAPENDGDEVVGSSVYL